MRETTVDWPSDVEVKDINASQPVEMVYSAIMSQL